MFPVKLFLSLSDRNYDVFGVGQGNGRKGRGVASRGRGHGHGLEAATTIKRAWHGHLLSMLAQVGWLGWEGVVMGAAIVDRKEGRD